MLTDGAFVAPFLLPPLSRRVNAHVRFSSPMMRSSSSKRQWPAA